MNNDWKTIELGKILTEEQLEDVQILLKNDDWNGLRIYLNKIKKHLESKGVISDYLYYCLESQLRRKII